jgi:hypothetical protein
MAFRPVKIFAAAAALPFAALLCPPMCAQVFVVGEKTATDGISTDFHPTRVEISSKPMNELGRRELMRDLEAEQGFAHRALPLACEISLIANGNMTPAGEAYKQLVYKKGQSAAPGDRVVITGITFKPDRILFDVNGGPYLKHRILRHIELNGVPIVRDDGEQVSGFRIALMFEGLVPDISAPEVKGLLDPIIDFGVKTGAQAYADTLPPFLKQAVDQHDVLVGMNRRMVLAAMGAPQSKIRELVPGSDTQHYEEWIYGRVPQTVRFVRIIGDRVTQVRIAALGQPVATHNENELQGFLDPLDEHEIAMGDQPVSGDDEARPSGPPPTILKPGEAGAGGAQRVQYPVPAKAQPLPAAPGSPADTSATQNQDQDQVPLSEAPGISRTGSPASTPGSVPSIGHPYLQAVGVN